MMRISQTPRPGWQKIVESQGLVYHSLEGRPYWDESAYYLLEYREVEELETATAQLNQMCLQACQAVIDQRRYAQLGIPALAIPLIEQSWEAEPPSLYGRMDLAFGAAGQPPKLLEYNADTPTALLEAAVIQWFWLQDRFPAGDQFNSIHERLEAKWRELAQGWLPGELVHFASLPEPEDVITANYLRDLAQSQGLQTQFLPMADIGFDSARGLFVDMEERPITSIFKLYPWEWLLADDFARHLPGLAGRMVWMEPAWKMLLANKGLLALLWEMFPGHPNLLPAYLDGPRDLEAWVKKPLLGREGRNVSVYQGGGLLQASPGNYGREGFVYQGLAVLPQFDGRRPLVGSWVIDQEPAGIGLRESEGLITQGDSPFVPHRLV